MRLDKYLSQKYPKYSRSHLQKLIKEGKVLVNGKTVRPHYKIKRDDNITENITPPEKIDLSPDKLIKLDIVYEDKDYLVINKPAGLVVHPSESVKSHTLINALLAYCPSIKNVGDYQKNPSSDAPSSVRPGIVHRLDKDVSGLMVIAKTQKAFDDLKRQFKSHEVKKEYTALVYGDVKKDEGEISIPIGRSKEGFKMSARTQPKEKDKTAITKFKIIKRYPKYSLLKIQTLTGRTHQIRVHLHAIGHPVVGDIIYKTKKVKADDKISRIFLHADQLEFHDLNDRTKEFKLDLPKELKNILKNL